MSDPKKMVKLRIWRGDSNDGGLQDVEVEANERDGHVSKELETEDK